MHHWQFLHPHKVLTIGVQGSFADKAWRRRVGKKIKFCFSKSRLADHLEDLKALNDEFRTLSAQTFILEAARNQKVSETSCKLSRDIEKFRLIQKASQKVYEALGRSCTKHTEHLTHFCLDAVAVDNGPSPQVQFKLAFTHLTLQGSLSSADPVWFMVESIIGNNTGESVQLSQASVGLVQTLKRSGDLSNEPSNKKPKKSVHFQSRAPSSIPYPIVSTEPEVPLTNLCMRKNFCDQLRGWFQRSPQEHRCLGTLDDTDCYKHLIYFPPPTFNYGRRPATSLEHVISTLSQQGPQGRFSQRDRIHLAYSLATAVLRYHATPWLKGSWRSDDIYFFDFDEKAAIEQQPNLSPPHLRVSVKGPDSALSRTSTFPPRDLAANSLLFGLGVLLIEIGYTATLKSLQRPSDIRDVENKFTEYYVAKRLASSIAREMGTAYGKIVKKCLQCDFGCGDDLNEPELQAGFHRDVVKELKRLEDELGDLHLGP